MRVADEYVWIYGEKFRWWPTPSGGVKQQTWPEALPGCEEILRYVRDPVDYARVKISEMKEAGKLVNLARNGDFSAAAAADAEGRQYAYREGGPPAGWSAWQETGGHGAFTWDRETGASGKGAARASGVSNGCFLQDTPVAPGQRYAVRASLLLRGAGDAWLRVRWRTADGQWTRESQDKIFYGAPTGDVWREVFGVVEAPEGAGRLVILLGVAGQKAGDDVVAGDIVWFDDVALYRLP
jgi:hypothetical protein